MQDHKVSEHSTEGDRHFHGLGRTVKKLAGEDGDWVEAARKLLDEIAAQERQLLKIADVLHDQAVFAESPTERKRLVKVAQKAARAAHKIAEDNARAVKLFSDLALRSRKKAIASSNSPRISIS